MALSTDEEAELLSLKGALLKLRTGQMPERIVYQGHETNFNRVSLPDLKSRIGELEAKQADACGRGRGGVRFRL